MIQRDQPCCHYYRHFRDDGGGGDGERGRGDVDVHVVPQPIPALASY